MVTEIKIKYDLREQSKGVTAETGIELTRASSDLTAEQIEKLERQVAESNEKLFKRGFEKSQEYSMNKR